MRPRIVVALLLASMAFACLPQVTATGPAPTGYAATYDGPTDTLTLSWKTPTGSVTGYNVYKDGALLGTTTGTTYSLVVGDASTGHSYTVAALDADGVAGTQTPPINVYRPVVPDTFCGIVTIVTYTEYPYVSYVLHQECIP